MKELVVGLDGSDESRAALRWASTVAKAGGAPCRIVAAWTYPGISVLPGAQIPVSPPEMDQRTIDDAVTVVADELGELPPLASINALRGPTAGAILETLTPTSTLVLGSRGRGGFAGLVLGSVSRECIEHAPCPVVIVRQDRPLGANAGPILVGKDGSANAELALDWALDLRNAVGGDVVALYAWRAGMAEVRPGVRDRIRTRASDAIEDWTIEHDDVRAVEVEGDARSSLADGARDMNASVVVVGRRGASRLRGITVGSVTSYLLANSAAPVAVVPPRDDGDATA